MYHHITTWEPRLQPNPFANIRGETVLSALHHASLPLVSPDRPLHSSKGKALPDMQHHGPVSFQVQAAGGVQWPQLAES